VPKDAILIPVKKHKGGLILMKSRQTGGFALRPKAYLLTLLVSVFAVVGVLGLVGCNGSGGSGGGEAINSEEVSGVIIEITADELLVEITKSTAPGLQAGLVRVDVSQIDSKIVDNLEVDDAITFEFSGIMGMSEPPFVSATSLSAS